MTSAMSWVLHAAAAFLPVRGARFLAHYYATAGSAATRLQSSHFGRARRAITCILAGPRSPKEESMRFLLPLRVLAAWFGLTMMLVAAAPAQSPPSPSPEALAAAHELLVAMHAADTFKSFLPTFMQAMKPAIVQNRSDVERDYDTIIPLLLERANAHLDEMLERMAPIYARNFTVDEIKDVTAFYRSLIGQKLVSRLPAISKESFAVGQDFGRQIAVEMRSRMIEELRKKGHTIGDPATAH